MHQNADGVIVVDLPFGDQVAQAFDRQVRRPAPRTCAQADSDRREQSSGRRLVLGGSDDRRKSLVFICSFPLAFMAAVPKLSIRRRPNTRPAANPVTLLARARFRLIRGARFVTGWCCTGSSPTHATLRCAEGAALITKTLPIPSELVAGTELDPAYIRNL